MLPSLLCILALQLGYGGAAQRLQLDAVVSSSGHAALECWEMETPFHEYPTAGRAIMGLANVTNVSYVVLPPNSNEGIHKPPHPM